MSAEPQEVCALVTGAARRLGRAIALDLAHHGWRIGVHYQSSKSEALSLVAEIEAFGGKAVPLRADLAKLQDVEALIPDCIEALGPPILLVNNAARFEWDWPDNVAENLWALHQDINLRAPIFLTKAFASTLPAGREGHVINLIDQKVRALNPHYFSYTIAKSALWTATQTLAQALAPRIRVNAIAPGPVLPHQGQSKEDFERECNDTLLKRAVSLDDITRTVRFLLENRSITGQLIALDGGRHLNWRPDEA